MFAAVNCAERSFGADLITVGCHVIGPVTVKILAKRANRFVGNQRRLVDIHVKNNAMLHIHASKPSHVPTKP